MRRRRFEILRVLIDEFPSPVRILDVGGRLDYWEKMTAGLDLGKTIQVTLLNLETSKVDREGFTALVGDARSMPQYADGQFDIVFSNSTIEHVGSAEDQERMANEVRRVGRAYCVQTPNRFFPIEPHFLFPFFQFLPLSLRIWLVQHFALGWHAVMRDREQAFREVSSIELLSRSQFQRLFPDGTIHEERFWGLVKSFVVIRRTSEAWRPV